MCRCYGLQHPKPSWFEILEKKLSSHGTYMSFDLLLKNGQHSIFYFQFAEENTEYHDNVRNVVVVVELQRFNVLWGYAVEPLMSDRCNVRFKIKRDTGGFHFRDASAHQTSLCKRTQC